MGEVRIGISGWRYEPWRGVFYPPGLAQHRELVGIEVELGIAHTALPGAAAATSSTAERTSFVGSSSVIGRPEESVTMPP